MAGLKFMLSDTKRDFRLKGSATAFNMNNSVTAPNLVLVFFSTVTYMTCIYAIVFYCFCGCIDLEITTEIADAHLIAKLFNINRLKIVFLGMSL